jgi:hypothetical protein
MSQTAPDPEPAFHLFLDRDEAPVLARAVRLLISDEAHEPAIRTIARELLRRVLEKLPDEHTMRAIQLP